MLRTGVRNNSATVDAMLRRHAQVVGCNHHLLLRYPPGQSCQHPQLSQLSRPASSVHHKLSQQFGVQRQLGRLLSGFAIGGGSLRKGSGGHGVEGRGLTVGVMSGDSGKQPEPESATGHKHTNRLVKEQSPYLLQHAHNPVDWYPWGEEAFAKARAEDKPIFLSVGYSTCHWCHVMEVESFESDEVAKLMNDWFVSIKVDREERPDVDKVYMTYVQATQGGGGWPMSVFLTPELKPIVGGTYFPPDDKYGRPGFKTALKRVKEVWDANKDSIRETGDQVIQQLSDATTARASSTELGEGSAVQAVQLCAQQLAKGYDPKLGGFGGPPKFPRPVELNVILRRFRQLDQSGKESAAAKVLEMALFTMRSMANGGIHDHLGGGFHRYSVDEYWHVPHFEKMLYDQGQLVNVFLDAFAITKDVQYASFARDILDYIRRDMTDPEGGIYSAEDADSAETQGATRKREGAFYVWTRQEIGAILGEDRAKIFSTHYYVKPGGNCDLSRMSDPHKEFVGKNALIQRQSLSDTAAKCGKSTDEVTEILASCRRELHSVRNARPRPLLDDKVIVAWNGLVISALARASRILKVEPENAKFYFPVMGREPNVYLASAEKAAAYLKKKLYDEKTHRLKRSFRVEPSDAPGFLEDYAFLISALLDLYEAGGNTSWLAWALDLQEKQDEFFLDASGGGYFSTPEGDSSILFRVKDDYDGAEPSGNSVAAINLLRLSALVGGEKANYFRRTAEHLLAVFEGRIKEVALAIPLMCCAFDTFHTASKRQIIVSGGKDATDTQKLVSVCHSFYDPDRTILQIDPNDPQDVAFWGKHNPAALAVVQSGRKERATAYVCQNFTCRAPTSEPEILERSLRQANVPPEMTTFKIGTTSLSK